MSELKLVRGRWVITGGGPLDETVSDGAVAIEGDTILDVGDYAEMLHKHPDAERFGSEHVAILPGLINAHHHSHGVSTIQQGRPDMLLEPWILAFAGTRTSDVYLNTLLSCARELRSGVTAVVDVHSGGGTADEYAATVDRALRAYDESGMRAAFTAGVTTQSFLVHGEGQDRAFLDSLPAQIRARAEQLLPPPKRVSDEEYLDIVMERAQRFQDHPLIDVWFGPPGPQWVSDDLMQSIAERAAALDTGIQTHCVESFYEMLHGERFYNQPTVLHLRDLGVLSPRFSLAHGVWLKEIEIEALAESGAAVSHNPSSNLRLRAGIAPLNALLAAGVTTGLGMDGTTINEDEDMFAEMRLAMRLHRTPMLDAPAPSPADVLELATAGGARLMRKEASLGKLAAGYKADIVLVDLQDITWPWVSPEVDARDLILMRTHASDVKDVFVAGETVLKDGSPTRFDVDAAARELAAGMDKTPYPEERALLVKELTPHLEAWYEAWGKPELAPYISYNSKL